MKTCATPWSESLVSGVNPRPNGRATAQTARVAGAGRRAWPPADVLAPCCEAPLATRILRRGVMYGRARRNTSVYSVTPNSSDIVSIALYPIPCHTASPATLPQHLFAKHQPACAPAHFPCLSIKTESGAFVFPYCQRRDIPGGVTTLQRSMLTVLLSRRAPLWYPGRKSFPYF